MSRRARYAVPIILVLFFVLGWALWPRGPALFLYTTPPITLRQKTFRLQALIPDGWKPGPPTVSTIKVISGGPAPVAASIVTVTIDYVRPGPAWITEWLRSRLWAPDDGRVILYGEAPPRSSQTKLQTGISRMTQNKEIVASRAARGPGAFFILYSRQNRSVFESTYRQICESFRVID